MKHFVFAIAIGFALSSVGCHDHRQQLLRGDLALLKHTRDEYTTWDPKHQDQLVDDVKASGGTKDDAVAKVELFRKTTQAVMLDIFSYAFEAVATAATGTDNASVKHATLVVTEIADMVHGKKPTEDLGKAGPDLPCRHAENAPVASICEGR